MANTKTSIPQKKEWRLPELVIISRADVTAKNHPRVHEHTGHYYGNSKGIFFGNNKSTYHITLTRAHAVVGHKSSATS